MATHAARGEQGELSILSEDEAVRMALARTALDAAVEGSIGVARGDAIDAGLWPNPELSYAREQTEDGPSASKEDYLSLSQTFDLSGRRRLGRRAADRRVGRAVHEGEALRRDVAAETRLRFFEVLLIEERVAVARRLSAHIDRLADAVAKREAAGDVSGYDRRRIGRERASASARLLVDETALGRARERLRALIGADAQDMARLTVAGALLPDDPLPSLDGVLASLPGTPAVQALDEEIAAAHLEQQAAGRWWLPDLTLGAGYKGVDLPTESLSGFLLSASIPLPLLDRGQGRSLRSESRRRLAEGRRSLELERVTGEVRGLWEEASRLAEAARTHRSTTAGEAQTLARIAEAAYEGGEVGVLELVDAHRGAADTELLALDLEAQARRARVELERLSGGGPQ